MTMTSPTRHALLAFTLLAGLGTLAQAEDWGTLTGRIVYDGTAPKPAPIDIKGKDPEVCGKKPLFDEKLEVGSDGGIKDALVFVRTDKVAVAPAYEESAKADVVVDNKGCRFEPHVSILRLGQTLVIKNSDPVAHNTKADPFENGPFNDMIPSGDEKRKTWDKAEKLPVPIGCNIHPWMSGLVLVRPNPYAAVTDAKGNFTIKDLPVGQELEFQLWQENPGNLKNAKNKEVKVDKTGRFKYKVKPGDNNLGDFLVGAAVFKKS
jgi:plastocyanin